jgi:hypothetical protein
MAGLAFQCKWVFPKLIDNSSSCKRLRLGEAQGFVIPVSKGFLESHEQHKDWIFLKQR